MRAKHPLGIIFFPAYDWAISPSHPEREERLLYTQDQIFEEGIADIDGIHFFNPAVAEPDDVYRVHFPYPSLEEVATRSHLIAAGGVIRAFDAVMHGETDKAFAMVRPPGHHAQRVVYGDRGFCIINMEAVAIEHMRKEHPDLKVAIIDTDCHHGDGTQDIFWNDPHTLFISFHQDGRTLYPGTGDLDELGGPGAYGYNLNIPLPPHTSDEGFLHVLEKVVLPILDEYQPDLIINSAGQDNHYSDPLTSMNFSAQGYAKLNERLNPDIAVLEGGYSIQGALPYVNTGIILAMAGLDYSGVHEPDYDEGRWKQDRRITKQVEAICDEVLTRWTQRDRLRERFIAGRDTVERQRQVYYDTAGIMEAQVQSFKVCDRCSGVHWVHSGNDKGARLFGVTIPRDACHDCRKLGEAYYERAAAFAPDIRMRYLQNRADEVYLRERVSR